MATSQSESFLNPSCELIDPTSTPHPRNFALVHSRVGQALRSGSGSESRQTGVPAPRESKDLNPLTPHFLIYVLDDGTVRFSFIQPKETLLLLRGISAMRSREPFRDNMDSLIYANGGFA